MDGWHKLLICDSKPGTIASKMQRCTHLFASPWVMSFSQAFTDHVESFKTHFQKHSQSEHLVFKQYCWWCLETTNSHWLWLQGEGKIFCFERMFRLSKLEPSIPGDLAWPCQNCLPTRTTESALIFENRS